MVKQFPDICINGETEESLKNGAAQIVSLVKPSWRNEDFQYKIFTDGISNKLIGVYVGNVKFPDMADMVLVRVYGAKTELIIDRNAEIRNMTVLNQVGCGCELYAQFANGLAYEFLPGEMYTQFFLQWLFFIEVHIFENATKIKLPITLIYLINEQPRLLIFEFFAYQQSAAICFKKNTRRT